MPTTILDSVTAAFEGNLEILKQSDLNATVTFEEFVNAVHPTFLGSQYLYSKFRSTFISNYTYAVADGMCFPSHPSNYSLCPEYYSQTPKISCLIAAILGGSNEALEYILEHTAPTAMPAAPQTTSSAVADKDEETPGTTPLLGKRKAEPA